MIEYDQIINGKETEDENVITTNGQTPSMKVYLDDNLFEAEDSVLISNLKRKELKNMTLNEDESYPNDIEEEGHCGPRSGEDNKQSQFETTNYRHLPCSMVSHCVQQNCEKSNSNSDLLKETSLDHKFEVDNDVLLEHEKLIDDVTFSEQISSLDENKMKMPKTQEEASVLEGRCVIGSDQSVKISYKLINMSENADTYTDRNNDGEVFDHKQVAQKDVAHYQKENPYVNNYDHHSVTMVKNSPDEKQNIDDASFHHNQEENRCVSNQSKAFNPEIQFQKENQAESNVANELIDEQVCTSKQVKASRTEVQHQEESENIKKLEPDVENLLIKEEQECLPNQTKASSTEIQLQEESQDINKSESDIANKFTREQECCSNQTKASSTEIQLQEESQDISKSQSDITNEFTGRKQGFVSNQTQNGSCNTRIQDKNKVAYKAEPNVVNKLIEKQEHVSNRSQNSKTGIEFQEESRELYKVEPDLANEMIKKEQKCVLNQTENSSKKLQFQEENQDVHKAEADVANKLIQEQESFFSQPPTTLTNGHNLVHDLKVSINYQEENEQDTDILDPLVQVPDSKSEENKLPSLIIENRTVSQEKDVLSTSMTQLQLTKQKKEENKDIDNEKNEDTITSELDMVEIVLDKFQNKTNDKEDGQQEKEDKISGEKQIETKKNSILRYFCHCFGRANR